MPAFKEALNYFLGAFIGFAIAKYITKEEEQEEEEEQDYGGPEKYSNKIQCPCLKKI